MAWSCTKCQASVTLWLCRRSFWLGRFWGREEARSSLALITAEIRGEFGLLEFIRRIGILDDDDLPRSPFGKMCIAHLIELCCRDFSIISLGFAVGKERRVHYDEP